MPHADRPYLTRPLAGVDQALGEGSARQPVELLDQLRERLDRLDLNHPSASRRPPDQQAAPDQLPGQAAPPEENARASRPDRSSPQKEGLVRSRDDQLGDQRAGEPPAASQPAAIHAEPVGRAAKGEPYRPWFTDEPGTPWFAEQGIVE